MFSLRSVLRSSPQLGRQSWNGCGDYLAKLKAPHGAKLLHTSSAACRIKIITTNVAVGRGGRPEEPTDGAEPHAAPAPKAATIAEFQAQFKKEQKGSGYDSYRTQQRTHSNFYEKLESDSQQVDTEVRSKAHQQHMISRATRLEEREKQLAASEEDGERTEVDVSSTNEDSRGLHTPSHLDADALAHLRRDFPMVAPSVPLGKPHAPETLKTPEGMAVRMPVVGKGLRLPNLDAEKLPYNPDEIATWKVRYGRQVKAPPATELTLGPTLKTLAGRSPYDNVFRSQNSIFHLLGLVFKLGKAQSIEANYISFLSALFDKTEAGRHKFVIDMLYLEQRLSRKAPRTEKLDTLAEQFKRVAFGLGDRKIFQFSDTGAAVIMGVLHKLGAQRIFNRKQMGTNGMRVQAMNLDSTLVFADALSRVPVWLRNEYHTVLLSTTMKHLTQLMGFKSQPVESEVMGGTRHVYGQKGTAASFNNDQVVAYLRVLERTMLYPRFHWNTIAQGIRENIWSYSPGEAGIIANAASFLCLSTSKAFLNSFALRMEDAVMTFAFTNRIECVSFMLDRGKRCNASVTALLCETHLINDIFIKLHPYLAAKLFDTLMLLWLVDRQRFVNNRNARIAFIREHLLRCKEAIRDNYYTKPHKLANVESPPLADQAPFESLLLPVLTPLQCSHPPPLDDDTVRHMSQEEEANVRTAWDHSESVIYNCWVNGVYTSAAVLCNENGELTPWRTVSHLLSPRPAWWRNNFNLRGIEDGELIADEPLELDDPKYLAKLADMDVFLKPEEGEEHTLLDDPAEETAVAKKQQGKAAAVIPGAEDDLDFEHEAGEQTKTEDLDAEEPVELKVPKKRQKKRFITLDKAKMTKAGVLLRPIAITVYDDQMSRLNTVGGPRFNGFVATQGNILFQSGWAAVSIPASELSADLPTSTRQASLYAHLSKISRIPFRADLLQSLPKELCRVYGLEEDGDTPDGDSVAPDG